MAIAAMRASVAHEAIKRAHAAGKVAFFTDPTVLARPGSPVYNPLDVFVPSLVLMASSLTLLFAVGLLAWLILLVLILLYQVYGAPLFVHWRMHRRAVEAVLHNAHNLQVLWNLGGIAIGLKDWPERCVVAPFGDWRAFAGEYLAEPEPEPDTSEPAQDG